MMAETRMSYTGEDKFEPEVSTRPSVIHPEDTLISVGLKSVAIVYSRLVHHELHITMDIEKAKLLISKLQEGIDQHENKA